MTRPDQDKNIMFFSGTSHPKLGEEITNYLGISQAKIKISRFSSGEIYARVLESIRGMDTYVLQTGGHNVNEDMMELFIIVDALVRASAKSVNVVVPHFPYARQDKKSAPREPISARLMANLLQTSGIDRIIAMDFHADQIQGFFDVPVDHLSALPLFTRYFNNKGLKNMVVVAPDAGRAKACKKLADRIGAELAIIHKTRPEQQVAEVIHVIGNVKGKSVILYDDMVDTGGSVTQGIKALIKQGCNPDIYLATTHAIFSGPAVERLKEANFKEVVTTNTRDLPEEKKFPGLKIISAAPLFAEAIIRCHTKTSISELFDI